MAPRQLSDALFLAVAHPARRRILELLLERDETPVGELRVHFAMSLPALSQHLRVLREAGLVADRREGRTVRYRLTPEPLLEVVAWMQDFALAWRGQLDRLGAYLEVEAVEDAGTWAHLDRLGAHLEAAEQAEQAEQGETTAHEDPL